MRRILAVLTAVGLVACEDGPEQIFTPNEGNTASQNGYEALPNFFQEGVKEFDTSAGVGDSVERARFCDVKENDDQLKKMVVEPIKPDLTLGGLPLWNPNSGPVHADDLIGRPEDGKFCDPTVWSNALSWGPTNEIIAFINEETKLVESLMATGSYLGTMDGQFTGKDGNKVDVKVKLRERITIGDLELNQYASKADQATKAASWLNNRNISAMYRMLRETWWQEQTDESFDCVTAQVCDVIYTVADQSVPQVTAIVFQDSGVILAFSPEGHVLQVEITPVRVAPFEASATFKFLSAAGTTSPTFTSIARPSCSLDLATGMTWGEFKSQCIDDSKSLSRATYNVDTQRDSANVSFNGITLRFLHEGAPLKDGQVPDDADVLFGINFTRSLSASVDEFRASALAAGYKAKLEARLKALVAADPTHPLNNLSVAIPATLSSQPQRIAELEYVDEKGAPGSWVPRVVSDVQAAWAQLTPPQKAAARPANDQIWLLEPFVEAVIEAFSNGAYQAPFSFKGFRTTDDRRWVIGMGHYVQNGIRHRVEVQYSLNYGAVTSVLVDQGGSKVDQVFDGWNDFLRGPGASPYYGINVSQVPARVQSARARRYWHRGEGCRPEAGDARHRGLPPGCPGGPRRRRTLTVPGTSIADRGGYSVSCAASAMSSSRRPGVSVRKGYAPGAVDRCGRGHREDHDADLQGPGSALRAEPVDGSCPRHPVRRRRGRCGQGI